MATQAATARLALDASGFDKQANSSFREFSKQLTSVKDATDVAMRGAEALQKVFVRSLGGTIAIGAASALGDAMRDVGNRIGDAGSVALEAMSGLSGLAGSMEEGAARGAKLAAAADSVRKALDDLRNASPLQAAVFGVLGGDKVLKDLEEAQRGLAGQELLGGLRQGNRNQSRLNIAAAQGPEQLAAEQQRMADEKARRDLFSSAAFSGADAATKEKILSEFNKKLLLDSQSRQDALQRKYDEETQRLREKLLKDAAKAEEDFKKTMLDLDLADARRARESERASAELLSQAEVALARQLQARARTESANRGIRGLRSSAASEELDMVSAANPLLGRFIEKERKKQETIRSKNIMATFDSAVRNDVSEFNATGGRRTMADRRQEYIRQHVGKEMAGRKTLADVYRVLEDTLNKITEAPMIGVN